VIPPDVLEEELREMAGIYADAQATPATEFATVNPADTHRVALTQTKFKGRISK